LEDVIDGPLIHSVEEQRWVTHRANTELQCVPQDICAPTIFGLDEPIFDSKSVLR